MLGTILHGPHDVRCEEVPEPKILKPTDAIIRLSATCICGSDLWPFRGLNDIKAPMVMGHEYCGIVEEVGNAVSSVKPGQFVVGSFCISDNACPHCRFGFQSSCEQREFMTGAQSPLARVPLADGTLVATDDVPSDDLIASLLATSDVLGTAGTPPMLPACNLVRRSLWLATARLASWACLPRSKWKPDVSSR
jgi:threonine dehydrogenase-like Zn-dependent dehydrogenase